MCDPQLGCYIYKLFIFNKIAKRVKLALHTCDMHMN